MDFQSPEDLMKLKNKLKVNPRMIGFAVVAIFVITLLSTMFYQIDKDEEGVVLLLGKYVRTTPPGLHMKLPFNIERVFPVKVTTHFREEFGFRTSGVTRSRRSVLSRELLDESLMLTGDLNSLRVTWFVQYKIEDPVKYLFVIKDPVENIRDMSEAVIRTLVADYSVDEVISSARDEISDQGKEKLQSILEFYDSGIRITQLQLKDVNPPIEVEPAFNEVNQAEQEKARVINEAQQSYYKIIPKALGQAEQTVFEAEGYAVERINKAKGDANRFLAQLEEYTKAPDVTKQRLYLETMTEVLQQAKEKYIIDPSHGERGVLPLMDFRQEEGS